MIDAKRGDERIMRVTEIDGERASWVCEGELVRCDGCVNWGALAGNYSPDWCPVVQKHTRPTDWCWRTWNMSWIRCRRNMRDLMEPNLQSQSPRNVWRS